MSACVGFASGAWVATGGTPAQSAGFPVSVIAAHATPAASAKTIRITRNDPPGRRAGASAARLETAAARARGSPTPKASGSRLRGGRSRGRDENVPLQDPVLRAGLIRRDEACAEQAENACRVGAPACRSRQAAEPETPAPKPIGHGGEYGDVRAIGAPSTLPEQVWSETAVTCPAVVSTVVVRTCSAPENVPTVVVIAHPVEALLSSSRNACSVTVAAPAAWTTLMRKKNNNRGSCRDSGKRRTGST